MHRGLYAAASAMIVQETMHDVTANNWQTSVRRDSGNASRQQIFPEVLMDRVEKPSEDGSIKLVSAPFQLGFKGKFLIGDLSLANVMSETYMSTEEGAIQVTDAPLDAAILGEGYFTVQDGAGSLFYTRSGHFQRSAEGQLVTHDGMAVLGEGGPVEFGDAAEVSIGGGGQIIADGEIIDVLQVVTFPNPTYLRQAGRTTLAATENSGLPQPLRPRRSGSRQGRWRCPTSTWWRRWCGWWKPRGPTRRRPRPS